MQTFPIIRDRGHLLIEIGGMRALVDTGSPGSMAPEPLEWAGVQHRLPHALMGITPQSMSDLSGIQIDALIGCDLLAESTMRIRWHDGELDVGKEIPAGSSALRMDDLMGIPLTPISIFGQATNALFDTGAHLSYIDPGLVKHLSPDGEKQDFYPSAGQFTVPVYRVPVTLDDRDLDIEFGTLPDNLGNLLEMAMVIGGASAVIGTQFLDYFDVTISWQRQLILWENFTV